MTTIGYAPLNHVRTVTRGHEGTIVKIFRRRGNLSEFMVRHPGGAPGVWRAPTWPVDGQTTGLYRATAALLAHYPRMFVSPGITGSPDDRWSPLGWLAWVHGAQISDRRGWVYAADPDLKRDTAVTVRAYAGRACNLSTMDLQLLSARGATPRGLHPMERTRAGVWATVFAAAATGVPFERMLEVRPDV